MRKVIPFIALMALWSFTVGIRWWVHVEPGQFAWLMWVLAQGAAIGGAFFYAGKVYK